MVTYNPMDAYSREEYREVNSKNEKAFLEKY